MKKFIILIPIFNDWKSVFKLLENIDLQIAKWDAEVSVLIVNDASTESRASTKLSYTNLKSVRIMNMKKNQGHARCNATGLKFLTEKETLEIDKFRKEMIFVRSELRKVQNALRKDIEKLDSTLKFFNIFFVPILLIIISLVVGFIERRKRYQKHIVRETN